MPHMDRRAINAGFNYTAIPLYDQSLNEAERVADRAWAADRTHLASTGASPEHMAISVDYVWYMKLRMATTAIRGYKTPYKIIKGIKPSI